MDRKQHWEEVYRTREPDGVSWYQARPEPSLSMIDASGLPRDSAIIDVGGGASNLVDHLLRDGYTDLTVLDLSAAALEQARRRLGDAARQVTWVEGDITGFQADRPYALWHDRAVLHFLTDAEDRAAYLEALNRGTAVDSHVIIGTFALDDGPKKCSGLDVVRYSAETLQALLGDRFRLIDHHQSGHTTPHGAEQAFVFAHFLRG